MKIFGHPWIESEAFFLVSNSEEIKNTAPNSTLRIENFNIELLHYCDKNGLAYMVVVSDIKEAIFANLLHAKYLLCYKSLAKELMPIAQNYLFDAQVVALISEEQEIEEMARVNVDGVLFSTLIEQL